jgi:hypothetical protein
MIFHASFSAQTDNSRIFPTLGHNHFLPQYVIDAARNMILDSGRYKHENMGLNLPPAAFFPMQDLIHNAQKM